MKKILNACLIFGVIYLIFYQFTEIETLKGEIAKNEQNIESSNHKDQENNDQKTQIRQLGFFANFAANVIAKILESENGREFLLKFIHPLTNDNREDTILINNPNYLNRLFSIKALKNTSSDKIAYCGADVIVSYKIYNDLQTITQQENVSMHLGDADLVSIENVLIGMQAGETRQANIPYWYANQYQHYMSSPKEKAAGLNLEVTLHKIVSPNITNVAIFDDLTSTEHPIICGHEIKTKVKITNFNGDIIFKAPLSYRVGDSNYPTLLSYGLFNKTPKATRTLVSPAKYLKISKNTENKMFDKLNLKESELVLIELK
jgi:hypothetical protein